MDFVEDLFKGIANQTENFNFFETDAIDGMFAYLKTVIKNSNYLILECFPVLV